MTRNIGITFIFEDELFQIKVPRNSTWAKVRAEWADIRKQPFSEFSFCFDEEGEREVPFEGSMEDVLSHRSRTLTVFVQQLRRLEVILLGAPDISVKVNIKERTTPRDVAEEVKERLGLQQEVRLLSCDRPLRSDVPMVQQTGAGTQVVADVLVDVVLIQAEAEPFHLIVTDGNDRVLLNKDLCTEGDPLTVPIFEKDFKTESLRVFASDSIKQEPPCRLKNMRDGTVIDSEEPIIAFMTSDDILDGRTIFAVVERQIEIQVENSLSQQRLKMILWPSTRLSALLSHDQQHVLIGGCAVDSNLTLWSAGVQAGDCLTLTSCIQLSVFDASGRLHSVTADQHEAVLDLRQRLRQFATQDDFDIWHEGEILPEDERSLADNLIFHHSLLFVAARCRDVRLLLEGRDPVLMTDVPEGVRFGRFLGMASSALEQDLPPDTLFTCGCGRVLSDESEQRRKLPRRCCGGGRLLELKVLVPQLHTHQGATLSATFRLPSSHTFSALLGGVSRLCESGVHAKLQELEADILRSCLLLQGAAAVRVELNNSLDLLLRLGDQKIPWSVPSTQTAFEALQQVEFRTQCRIADFAARRDRPLNARRRGSPTFEDLRLRKGQELTAILLETEEKSSQTDFRTSFNYDSINVQVGLTSSTSTSQNTSQRYLTATTQTSQRCLTATTQTSSKVVQVSNLFPAPTRVAKFWILSSTSDQTYGSFRRENFNLDVPFQAPHFQVSFLREAVADFFRVHPLAVALEQERAHRRSDGALVFVTEGIGWADSSGRTWREYEVNHFKVEPLLDEQVLPFCPFLRWVINASVQRF